MIYPTEKINKYGEGFLNLDDIALDRLQKYGEVLAQWNEKINLTRVTEPEEVVIKHFFDSLTILKYVDIPENSKVIDVGTGAGFPGVVLKIAKPSVKLTLLDSLNKRVNFLKELTEELELPTNCIHSRAEEAGKSQSYREKYDFAVARAVANLRELSEYCLPFVKVGGFFIAMKGPDADAEIKDAENAINILGGEVHIKHELNLPDGSGRTIVVIKKAKPTPARYPRPSAKMAKSKL